MFEYPRSHRGLKPTSRQGDNLDNNKNKQNIIIMYNIINIVKFASHLIKKEDPNADHYTLYLGGAETLKKSGRATITTSKV